jgi:hypothetical protein
MASNTSGGGDGNVVHRSSDPAALLDVDFLTGVAIENAPFDPGAIVEGDVSYAMLLDAGVPPEVADELRRTHSLVWSFRWVEGADLERRAERVRGLTDAEREWIAASVADEPPSESTASRRDAYAETEWGTYAKTDWDAYAGTVERATGSGPLGRDGTDAACDRCGSDLATFSMGGRELLACESCGFSGFTADHRPRPRLADDSWADAVKRLVTDE